MRQVEARVMTPAIRTQANVRSVAVPAWNLQNAVGIAVLCAFWGVILYLGLISF